VHRLLPGHAALEHLAGRRHAIVGGIVHAEIGGKIRFQPRAKFLPEVLLLGGVFEVHGFSRCPGARLVLAARAVKRLAYNTPAVSPLPEVIR
jgi:hypothetical protein